MVTDVGSRSYIFNLFSNILDRKVPPGVLMVYFRNHISNSNECGIVLEHS